MTKNTTTSSYIEEESDTDVIRAVPIRDRFTEIDGEIRAIKAVFDVKLPRKRKFSRHEVYYRIVDGVKNYK